MTNDVLEVLPGLSTDMGKIAVRRLLPRRNRRLVGPWCFFDSYGPLTFTTDKPMDVAPHPHIGLQTVSWLLEGEALHNDSLGRSGVGRPGLVNLMTAGRGIAHSEETPPESSGRLRGVQLWVALPDASRHVEPSFEQHSSLPRLDLGGGHATVILGELGGKRSPATSFSPLVGAEITVEAHSTVTIPLDPAFEHAATCLVGGARIAEVALGKPALPIDSLAYVGRGRIDLTLEGGDGGARVLLVGGAPFDEPVLMWWNFVARSSDELFAARDDWEAGRRFGEVSAYGGARIAAPPFAARPVVPR